MLLELEFFGLADAVFPPGPWIQDAEFRAWGPKLNPGRYGCAAVLHGRSVVIFGGHDRNCRSLNTTRVLDLAAGTTESSVAGPTMATARFWCAAVRIDARRVLVVGGSVLKSEYSGRTRPLGCQLGTTEILDLETMRFSAGPTMLSRRAECTAVALDARRVLVAGGEDENNIPQRTTEILDIATMTFAPGPEMLSTRIGCSAVALENPRRVLVVGGCDYFDDVDLNTTEVSFLNTTEVLDLDTMAFSRGPTMLTARYGCTAVALGGSCLVIGGSDKDTIKVKTTEVLDLETMEFTGYGPAMLARRSRCVAVVDDAGDRVVVLCEGSTINTIDERNMIEVLEAAQDNTRATWRRVGDARGRRLRSSPSG
jgi:hypothetical protein